MKISLAILTMNEIAGCRVIVDRIPLDAVDEVIVMDGHSTDGTVEFFERRGISVIQQSGPGLGQAMIDARRAVTGDALIYFHPDGNEDPADIPKFRGYLEQGYDMVIASRMIQDGYNEENDQLIRMRKWANLGFAVIANVLWRREGPFISDMTNGFRAITCEAFDHMQLDSRDLTMDYQMIIRGFKRRMRLYEFPTHEAKRVAGSTTFASIPTGLKELGLVWRELIRGQRVFGEEQHVPVGANETDIPGG